MTNEQRRREISALVGDIERIQRKLGPQLTSAFRDPEDREAFDIVARIERRLRTRMEAAE